MKALIISFAFALITIPVKVAATDAGTQDKPVVISGKVVNAANKPVDGAVFYIDNIKTTFRSKPNGAYKIKVSPSSITLEVRSDEWGTARQAIEGRTEIDFVLKPDNLTGLAHDSSVSTAAKASGQKKPQKMNTYNNIYQMIRAEVPEVVVNGRDIQIRQGHSFFGSSTPLFVVNGVIVSSIDNINPVEVKSIKVIKGSAAAIYGNQGSNGVLSITLLNGSESQGQRK